MGLIMHTKQVLSSLNLLYLGFKGHPYTWKRGSMFERLDKAMGNFGLTLSQTLVDHLPFIPTIDHCLFLLYTGDH